MQATTWIDNIASESNLWLNAIKAEEGGELDHAAILYLRDASECLGKGMQLKAALSCSCAAGCIQKMGSQVRARELYAESAQIYLEKAQAVAGVSVREFLWCLRESYRAFQHANNREKAAEVHKYYVSLAGRIDPFIFADALEASEPLQAEKEGNDKAFEEGRAMTQEIERFLQPRRDEYRKMSASLPPKAAAPTAAKRRSPNHETSVINQLG
jgi:hypothetical protein